MSILFSPAAERNAPAILEVLQQHIPQAGQALEIASGSGQHIVEFATYFKEWQFQPTDIYEEALLSISQRIKESLCENILPPFLLDAADIATTENKYDLLLNINMIHISTWESFLGLVRLSQSSLKKSAILFIYGPFMEDNKPLAPSNVAFDQSLKSRNPEWGLRELSAVKQELELHGFKLLKEVAMPANNLSLIFQNKT